MQGGFQRAQCGQRNNPVAEDTVMDAFLFHLDGQFPLGEGIHVGKVLLKQLPMFQNVEGQMGQSQVADGLQFLVMFFLQDAERGLGVGQVRGHGYRAPYPALVFPARR